MSRAQINRAIIAIAEAIRHEQDADTLEAIVRPYGDAEHYVRQAVEAHLRKDSEAVKKNLRDAGRQGAAAIQLSLPGLDHSSLQGIVWVRNPETGLDDPKNGRVATIAEHLAELRKQRRSITIQDRIVSSQEATIERALELGATEDWTGAELEAAFPKEIEQ